MSFREPGCKLNSLRTVKIVQIFHVLPFHCMVADSEVIHFQIISQTLEEMGRIIHEINLL